MHNFLTLKMPKRKPMNIGSGYYEMGEDKDRSLTSFKSTVC